VQRTLSRPVSVSGIGLHSGAPARATLRPAAPGAGVAFLRTDLPGRPRIPALWDRAVQGPLATRLVEGQASVSTVEHLMAALAGSGVHNALVEIHGPEVPILDGSAAPWVRAILQAGTAEQDAPLRVLRVLEPVEVRDGAALARLEPASAPSLRFAIDFPDEAIGRQDMDLPLANGAFVRELSDSRTFCSLRDVEAMRARGLALGGTFSNAVVVDGARVLTPGGLRHPDEAVRHKMLDAVGDLGLAGGPVVGRFVGVRAGHAMTNRLLRALFARGSAWEWANADAGLEALLPGAGVGPEDLLALPAVA
jgi:UDP-3-O-[3-hydroxymyristoyl] N-acetylglucosamine deacetylase